MDKNVLENADNEISSKEDKTLEGDKTGQIFFKALTVDLILQSFIFRPEIVFKT